MANQLLVRNIPKHMTLWIEQRRAENRMSQQEFVFGLLQKVYQAEESQRTPLFSSVSRDVIEKPTPACIPFKFVDLFAGIGGFRIALEKQGGNCVFSCEWDKYSQKTYKAWFGDTPHGDIRKIKPTDIPDHDILAAGFPCQPF